MFRALHTVAVLVAALALVGCGNDDDTQATGATDPQQTATDERTPEDETPTSEEPTEGPPPVTAGPGDSDAVEQTAFERAYSECASTPLRSLAAKYKVARNRAAVSRAVGTEWARRVGETGSANVERAGRDACLQAFRQG